MSSVMQVGPSPFFVRRDDPTTARLLAALTAAVGLHLAVAVLVWAASLLGWFFAPSRPHESKVELVSMSKSQWEQHRLPDTERKLPSPAHAADEKQKLEVKPTPMPKGQIVDVAPGNDQKPVESKYLAEHDNTVDKQTRARETTPNYMKAASRAISEKPPPPKTEPNHSPVATGTESIAGGAAHPSVEAARAVAAQAEHKADKLVPTPNGDIVAPKDSERVIGSAARAPSDGENRAPSPTAGPEGSKPALLTPSVSQLGQMTGAAAPDDLSGVDMADDTFLNTRAFKYAAFFNRVKQRVGEQWNPQSVIRRRDPHGRIMSGTTRVTYLDVVLDAHGELRNVSVAKSCGVDFLDEEAVAAFERAAPFLNPPPGLFDDHGFARFGFGFHVDDGYDQRGARFGH